MQVVSGHGRGRQDVPVRSGLGACGDAASVSGCVRLLLAEGETLGHFGLPPVRWVKN
jgi:hypothetical protein